MEMIYDIEKIYYGDMEWTSFPLASWGRIIAKREPLERKR